ncbi:MAG: class I SAM-dependent rRNA methyltransferase [Planctomycetota bacterium]
MRAHDQLPTIELRISRTSPHPWIYRKMIRPIRGIPIGAFVEIVDKTGAFVGRGFYNSKSEIELRVLTTDPAEDKLETIFENRLRKALDLRERVLNLGAYTDAYRLVHAESDGLSGLVADRYGGHIVVQAFSAGIHRYRDLLRRVIMRLVPDVTVHVRADETVQKREGFELEPEPSGPDIEIHEGAVKFHVSLAGQKTGFFLDQRDNRRWVGEMAAGRTVLDLCCYTGGFSLHAGKGGAAQVTAVDLDESALAIGAKNARLNGLDIKFVKANIFEYLRALPPSEQYDLVVLDPAKQARVREEVPKAMKAYNDMNRLALQHLKPGGVLLTCSCSGLISEQVFLSLLKNGAMEAQCDLDILGIHGAAPDHPVALHCPETRYLKAVRAVKR